MRIFSIQRLSNCSADEREIRIGEGQRVTVGASPNADLRLHLSFGLPGICLEVWHDIDRCLAENVSRDSELVTLNGYPLYSVGQLEHGDLLQIGSDSFAVVFLEQSTAAKAMPPAAVADSAPLQRVVDTALKPVILNAATVRHEPVDAEWRDIDVLRNLIEQHQAFLFANFQLAGVPVPDLDGVGDDLFEHAPDEVREIYSLHAITDMPPDQRLQIYDKIRDLDAAVWVVPDTDVETCLKDAKIYLAWFARPSVLEMSLQKSPEVFCAALLKPFKAVMLKPSSGCNWVMYTKADFDPAQLELSEHTSAGA